MATAPTSIDPLAENPVKRAISLLSQQAWCWGRDVIRPEGNWLVEIGFDRVEPPADQGYVHPIVRLKGVFRCEDDWWGINRTKGVTDYSRSVYRRDSRLEIILDRKTSGWNEFEIELIRCLRA